MIKYFFLGTFILIGTACTQQSPKEFTIDSTLDSPFTGTVYLGHITDKYVHVDSIQLKEATSFTFTHPIEQPDKYRISFRPYMPGYEIIAEAGGKYQLSVGKISVIEGTEQKLMNQYLELIKPLEEEGNTLSKQYAVAEEQKNQKEISALQKKMTQHFIQRESTTVDFIKAHPQSYTAIELAGDLLLSEYPAWKEVYETIDTVRYTYSYAFRMLKEKMKDAQKVWLQNTQAPDFTTKDIHGKQVKLSDFKGQYLLLDFWASWCRPCRDKAKEIKAIYPQLKARGIVMCGINLDEKKAQWSKATQEDGIIWANTSELKPFRNNNIAQSYKVQQLPTLFLISPSGEIIKQNPSIEYLLSLPEQKNMNNQ